MNKAPNVISLDMRKVKEILLHHHVWAPMITLRAIKDAAMVEALYYYKGNKSAAAKALGISIRNMRMNLKRLFR